MKKILLGLALIVPALAANAQSFTEFFKVTYDGRELPNGSTVYITPAENPQNPPAEGKVSYEPHIYVINLEEDPRQIDGSFFFVNPTIGYYEEHSGDADYPYGFPSCCFAGGLSVDLTTPAASCLPAKPGVDAGSGTVIVPEAGKDTFNWQIHLEDADPETTTEMKLTLYAQDGYGTLGEELSEAYDLTLVFSKKGTGVEDITLDPNAPAEYYDLQGRRIANPAKGLYIVRHNGKVSKTIIR